MHGRGVYTFPDGRKYEGMYVNDKKSGYGIYTKKSGKLYEGCWLLGK